MNLTSQKTRGMELPCGENLIILTSTVFNRPSARPPVCLSVRRMYLIHPSDRQTDRRADGR